MYNLLKHFVSRSFSVHAFSIVASLACLLYSTVYGTAAQAQFISVGSGNVSTVKNVNPSCQYRLQLSFSASRESYYNFTAVEIDAQQQVFTLRGTAPASDFTSLFYQNQQPPIFLSPVPSPTNSPASTELGTLRLIIRSQAANSIEFSYSRGVQQINPVYATLQAACVCPPTKILDPLSVTCRCAAPCANASQVQDPATCSCSCAGTCPSGQVRNPATCSCGCSNTCQAPKVANSSCACVCPAITCPVGKVLDAASCTCRCATTSCQAPKVLDPASCGCKCSNTCIAPRVLNQTTCGCACPAVTCPAGKVLDPATCACGCRSTTCSAPKIFNASTCGCACPSVSCPVGKYLDAASCTCKG